MKNKEEIYRKEKKNTEEKTRRRNERERKLKLW